MTEAELVRKVQDTVTDGSMETITLSREHAEEAILVVTSTDFTVKPWDEENDIQFFIYDKVRHLELLKRFVAYLQKLDLKTTYEELVAASEEHGTDLGFADSSIDWLQKTYASVVIALGGVKNVSQIKKNGGNVEADLEL